MTPADNRRAKLDQRARRTREISRLKAYGRWVDPYTTPDRARAHITDTCTRYGISYESFGRLAGIHGEQIRSMMTPAHHQYPSKIRTVTERQILRVRLDLDLLAPDAWVNATGTRRRLRALARIGWTYGELGARIGTTAQGIGHFLSRRQVSAATARKVRDLFDELWSTAGPSKVTALRAERNGWVPPLALDDDRIDDVTWHPACDVVQVRSAADVAESVEFILADDPLLTGDIIAGRLGYADRSGLQNALKRAERGDLLDRLNRNAEIAGHNVRRQTRKDAAA